MKIALIYSGNGLDIDVLINMLLFYKKIGYKPIYANNFVSCHLLVVPRPNELTVIPESFSNTAIHIWNYAGNDLTSFFINNEKTLNRVLYICATHALLPSNFKENEYKIKIIGKPPVYTHLWTTKLNEEKKRNLINIGNFKPYLLTNEDAYATNFIKSIQLHHAHVWGKGWKNVNIASKGSIEVSEVSKIYATSKIGMGIMYPHQRLTTFSGRFWHGPLNGTTIISEPGIFVDSIPGVINSDLKAEHVDSIIKQRNFVSKQIQEESSAYWDTHTAWLEDVVQSITTYISINTITKISHIYFYKQLADNNLRKIYRMYRGKIKLNI